VNFLFVLIELLSLGVTAEALRVNTAWKSAFFEGDKSFSDNFSRRRGRTPRTVFSRIDRPMNALQLLLFQYSHKVTL